MDEGDLDDDSTGFAQRELEHLRAHYLPTFDWVRHGAPSPRRRPPVPLAQARVGIVSTAGAHRAGEPPLGATGRVAVIEAGARVTLTHPGYDTDRAAADPEVVYPVATLEALAEARVIGHAAPTVLSTMGGTLKAERVLERGVPPTVSWAQQERLDLVLLVPA